MAVTGAADSQPTVLVGCRVCPGACIGTGERRPPLSSPGLAGCAVAVTANRHRYSLLSADLAHFVDQATLSGVQALLLGAALGKMHLGKDVIARAVFAVHLGLFVVGLALIGLGCE